MWRTNRSNRFDDEEQHARCQDTESQRLRGPTRSRSSKAPKISRKKPAPRSTKTVRIRRNDTSDARGEIPSAQNRRKGVAICASVWPRPDAAAV